MQAIEKFSWKYAERCDQDLLRVARHRAFSVRRWMYDTNFDSSRAVLKNAASLSAAVVGVDDDCLERIGQLLHVSGGIRNWIPSSTTIRGEIEELLKRGGSMVEERLIYPVRDVVVEGLALGPYELVVGGGGYASIIVNSLDEYAPGSEGITHPHINGGFPCFGSNAVLYENMLRFGLLVDTVEMLEKLLRSYNSYMPFARIENFQVDTCATCGKEQRRVTMSICGTCGKWSCHKCVVRCQHCLSLHCLTCHPRTSPECCFLCNSCRE